MVGGKFMPIKRIIYTGYGDGFDLHGMNFKTGIVYAVSDGVFEWARRIRYFHEVKGTKKGVIDFPTKKDLKRIEMEKEKIAKKRREKAKRWRARQERLTLEQLEKQNTPSEATKGTKKPFISVFNKGWKNGKTKDNREMSEM